MNRLMEKIVFCGLVTACRLATCPTSRSPSFVKATTDGVVRPPSALGMTTGSPPSITATTELVVPRSIPMIFSAILSAPDRDLMPAGCYGSQKASIVPKTNAKKADAETGHGTGCVVTKVCQKSERAARLGRPFFPCLTLPRLTSPRLTVPYRATPRDGDNLFK